MRSALRILGALVALYLVACGALFLGQRALLFPAPRADDPGPEPILGVETWPVHTSGGGFAALLEPAREGAPTVVYFHGNAEDVAGLGGLARALGDAGMGLFAIEYPGYGRRAHEAPSAAGVLRAAESGLEWLVGSGVPGEEIVLLGRSLGSGPAVEMAARGYGAAVVLVAPFTSIADLAGEVVPWAPVGLLLRDRFDNVAWAADVEVPVLIVHGAEDEVIPAAHGRALLEAFPAAELRTLGGFGHNDLPLDALIADLVEQALARSD